MWKNPMFKIKGRGCLVNNEEFRKKYLSDINPSASFPIKIE
jgi:hypothetical protein